MQMSVLTALSVVALLMIAACTTSTPSATSSAAPTESVQSPLQAGQVSDGWGAAEGPVTGGSRAIKAHIYRVSNRAELAHALMAGSQKLAAVTPKVIFIDGTIDLSVDENNRPLFGSDYRDPMFSWDDFARAFDPAMWGKRPIEGPLEDARKRSAERQQSVVMLHVGSNTSLIGVGNKALIKNGSLMLKSAENIIIRNIAFEDSYDYFPQWDPNDNAGGEWNAAYDNVTLYSARRIWIDRCTFSDGVRPDHLDRVLLGRPMQFHDGLLDIVRGSDLITVSNSHFKNHDKGNLIGNSDNRTDDAGKLRVTMHHNWFDNVKERSPRVRFGRVHVYNNLYTATADSTYSYGYSIGVGYQSQIVAQNNVFEVPAGAVPRVFKLWRGERFQATGNLVNAVEVNALQILRLQTSTAIGAALNDQLDWTPTLHLAIDPTARVAQFVRSNAGAGR